METLYYIIIFIFGTIIGSFLNVIINRYNTGISINGRSVCFSCGKKLLWYELVPIVSFLVQGGRCRGCESRISFQYPIIEITTGLLFLLTYKLQITIHELLYYWIISSLLIVITVYDFKHKIIPNSFVYAFIILSFLGLFVTFLPVGIYLPNRWELLAGPILAVPFALLWLLSRGTWMGLGDAKLALGIGWLLGLYYGLSAIILAFWIGAVWGIILLIMSHTGLFLGGKKLTMKSEIPFGPFLVLGMLLIILFNIDVFNLLVP